ncbi:response regulator [Brevundimonas sp. R86498]|uniref:response regulator n=1 Tax=Brevundimonas sp. R86498 TaxID=3093845 RepID=UPI0037CCA03C
MSDVSVMARHPFAAAWNCLRRPVWLYNPQTGHQAYANPAALSLWDADNLDEFLARDFRARSPAVKARLRRLVDLTADGGMVSERWTVFPNGEPITIQATISAFPTDEWLLLLFEAAPEEVQADERRSVEALRHAAALIGLFDTGGAPLFTNPAAYRVYGGDSGCFTARFADTAQGVALLAAARSASVDGMYAVITPAGPRWHHMDARPVLDPVTGLPCILLNEQDVTAQIEAELARSAAEQKAQIADARQRFLTEMSHELRTPLNAVIGFSGLLADAGLAGTAGDQAQRIHSAGLGLLQVVDRMIAEPADAALPQVPEPAGPRTRDVGCRAEDLATTPERALRALYVDDNENNRTLVRAMLATMGFVCETANDGHTGVEAAARGDWDVILMDIQMPGLNGVAAARQIRALPGPVAGTPIIALTANTLAAQIQTYVEAGMDDCVAKPVNMMELLTKTSHWARSGWRQAVMADGVSATG